MNSVHSRLDISRAIKALGPTVRVIQHSAYSVGDLVLVEWPCAQRQRTATVLGSSMAIGAGYAILFEDGGLTSIRARDIIKVLEYTTRYSNILLS